MSFGLNRADVIGRPGAGRNATVSIFCIAHAF